MALRHEKPDRVPFNFWMDRRLMGQYEQRLAHRHWRVDHYGTDVIEAFAALPFPTGTLEERDGSVWLMSPCFTDWSQALTLELPDPSRDAVYGTISRDLAEFPYTAVFLDMPTAWGIIAAGMRGYENVYVDMYQHPEEFHQLLRRITDIQKTVVEKACQMGITALYLMEDLATSKGLSMSPAMIEEFCLNYAQELADVAHQHEIPVLWHSDGNIADLVELLIPLGIAALNPLQPNVNDMNPFMEKYGKRIAVYGGLDNCFVIPEGSPKDVHNHVRRQFDILGRPSGGLIFSTHDIPLETPQENVEVLVTAIKECIYG